MVVCQPAHPVQEAHPYPMFCTPPLLLLKSASFLLEIQHIVTMYHDTWHMASTVSHTWRHNACTAGIAPPTHDTAHGTAPPAKKLRIPPRCGELQSCAVGQPGGQMTTQSLTAPEAFA